MKSTRMTGQELIAHMDKVAATDGYPHYTAEAERIYQHILINTHGDAQAIRAQIDVFCRHAADTGYVHSKHIDALVISRLCAFWLSLPV